MRAKTALISGAVALTLAAGAGWGRPGSPRAHPLHQARTHTRVVDGHQIVTLPNDNVPNFQRRTVYCPPGKHVVGGGAEAQGNDAILVGSFPTPDGTGWIALGRQSASSTVGISVYAIRGN
ncbi:hypothetical protein QF032_007722 [Streptomyces achromogenes]|uniref:hypothetical protein n=1 Tax=Streptomyces achromogenes TaxID=67255 RepID=UPI00278461F3|nr:hypothetical protein [Streptomyces achromogenes]MDQ0835878.1 hypothetical protein [Streptomyces achromogenes]